MADTITVTRGLISKEDIAFEAADATADETFARTKSDGDTQTLTKLGASHINIRDANNYLTATTVEAALQELAASIAGVADLHSGHPAIENGQEIGLTYATSFDWYPAPA